MVQEALRLGRRSLSEISDEAALEAELLLSCAMNMDRVTLYQQLNEQVSAELEVAYQDLLARRCSHEPTPYIVGRKEFYGIEFQVTPAAIIPRPETESLVEQVLAESGRIIARKSSLLIVDVGVGCGTIAIAIAANESRCDIIATDSSAEALALAEENAEKHGLAGRVDFIQGDGLQSLSAPVDMIVANSSERVNVGSLTAFSLSEAYPNPFNPTTSMTLAVPQAGHVSVHVYNIMGQVVATLASGYMDASTYTLTWDASDVSSGMYFVKAEAAGIVTNQKLLLIK